MISYREDGQGNKSRTRGPRMPLGGGLFSLIVLSHLPLPTPGDGSWLKAWGRLTQGFFAWRDLDPVISQGESVGRHRAFCFVTAWGTQLDFTLDYSQVQLWNKMATLLLHLSGRLFTEPPREIKCPRRARVVADLFKLSLLKYSWRTLLYSSQCTT